MAFGLLVEQPSAAGEWLAMGKEVDLCVLKFSTQAGSGDCCTSKISCAQDLAYNFGSFSSRGSRMRCDGTSLLSSLFSYNSTKGDFQS